MYSIAMMKETIKTINPATEQIIQEYEYHTASQIREIVDSVALGYEDWKQQSLKIRLNFILILSTQLSKRKNELALIITEEMGKPISQSISEINKCISLCEYYINNSEKILKPNFIKTNYSTSYYTYAPLGIIFGIMPWNFPIWQVMRFAIPNLIIGNSVLLKHSLNTSGVSLILEELFKASLPKNLFRSLFIKNETAELIIKDSNVAGVTITGSKKAGADVAMKAGANIKKTVLELGGNDPYIILDDANLDLAAEECVKSRLLNTGQVCIAAKRIIICESVRCEFEKKLITLVQKYQYTNPDLHDLKLGPLARKDIKDNLQSQVQKSLDQGSNCIYKNTIPEGKGYYFPVTILNNVDKNNIAFKEELFGPIFCITSVKNEKDAIKYANMSEYGLSAVVFTQNIKKGEDICLNQLNFGTCNLNQMVSSDPKLPFGGVKNSGYGRELYAAGLKEFANMKTININKN